MKKYSGKPLGVLLMLLLGVLVTGCAHYDKGAAQQIQGPAQQAAFHCSPEVQSCRCEDPLDCWILGDSGLCGGPLTCGPGGCNCELGASSLRLSEFLEPYEGIDVANQANPYDFIGFYHNAGVDFLLENLESADSEGHVGLAEMNSLVARFTSSVSSLLEKPEVRTEAREASGFVLDALTRQPHPG